MARKLFANLLFLTLFSRFGEEAPSFVRFLVPQGKDGDGSEFFSYIDGVSCSLCGLHFFSLAIFPPLQSFG